MKIEPTYVMFEQSKLLKEKGFNVPTNYCYEYALTSQKDEETGEYSGSFGWKEGECNLIQHYFINNHTSDHSNKNWYMCSAPEQWQVVEWLLDRHHIHIQVYPLHDDKWEWCIMFLNEPLEVGFKSSMSQFCVEKSIFDSKQEAYSSVFNYILNKIL